MTKISMALPVISMYYSSKTQHKPEQKETCCGGHWTNYRSIQLNIIYMARGVRVDGGAQCTNEITKLFCNLTIKKALK